MGTVGSSRITVLVLWRDHSDRSSRSWSGNISLCVCLKSRKSQHEAVNQFAQPSVYSADLQRVLVGATFTQEHSESCRSATPSHARKQSQTNHPGRIHHPSGKCVSAEAEGGELRSPKSNNSLDNKEGTATAKASGPILLQEQGWAWGSRSPRTLLEDSSMRERERFLT